MRTRSGWRRLLVTLCRRKLHPPLDDWRESIWRVDLSTLRPAQLRIQYPDYEPDDRSGGASDENAEQRSLVCLRRKHDRSDKANYEANEPQNDGTGDAAGECRAASACLLRRQTI